MKNDELLKTITILVIVFILCIIFLYSTTFGIKIGYKMSGGQDTVKDQSKNEELIRDYEKYKSEYKLYKDSSNTTMKKWAKNAMEKANDIVDKYYILNNDNKLEKIGE